MSRRPAVRSPYTPAAGRRRPVCWCGKGQSHPWGSLSTCTSAGPVAHKRRLFHILLVAGQAHQGTMCGADTQAPRVCFMPVSRARARAWDPANTWDLCPMCAEGFGLDTNGEELQA